MELLQSCINPSILSWWWESIYWCDGVFILRQPISISDKTFCHNNSESLEPVRLSVKMFLSLWNITLACRQDEFQISEQSRDRSLTLVTSWDLKGRDHCVHAPSQWETTLHCNVVSHWLSAYTKMVPGPCYSKSSCQISKWAPEFLHAWYWMDQICPVQHSKGEPSGHIT